MSKTTQQTIDVIVWQACYTPNDTINLSHYKDYVLTMLFIKYISDIYKEKLQELEEKYSDNPQRIERSLQRERFKLSKDTTFEYVLQHKESEHLGEIINKVLEKIEINNPENLANIFSNLDFNNETLLGKTKKRNARLKHLLESFNNPKLDLRPSKLSHKNVLGDSYEYFLSHFANVMLKKEKTFFTPPSITTLLAQLLEPQEGDKIYDPTCGSGTLLIKTAQELTTANFRLYGQDTNAQTLALCKINMFFHNIYDTQLEWGDTLTHPLHVEDGKLKTFDIVLAHPPFSLDNWGAKDLKEDQYKRFERGMPPKSKGDYAFVLHMLATLNERGKMGIILPHGVLFRGASEGKIRKQLIDENLLDAVIGLPANLLFDTNIPTCILLFNKQKTTTNILFIDASHTFTKEKNQNILHKEHIHNIVETYKEKKESLHYAHYATLQEIQTNNYNLNIARYIETFEECQITPLEDTKKDIEHIEKELKQVQIQLAKLLEDYEVQRREN
jgi:type I restriction enzyme M protein